MSRSLLDPAIQPLIAVIVSNWNAPMHRDKPAFHIVQEL